MTTLVKGHTPLEAIDKVHKDTTEVAAWLSLFCYWIHECND
jgi:hypothetical protein